MKHLFKATLLLLALLLPTTAYTYDFEVDGIYYNKSGSKATVTYQSYSNGSFVSDYTGDVTIPSTVTFNGTTYSVTSIGHFAFYNCNGLTSVTIPNSVIIIGERAFYGCSGLTSITIPNSVTSIGSSTFQDCNGLSSLTIPYSVTSIGDNAFSGTTWFNNQPDGLVYAGLVAYKYKGTMPEGTSIILIDGTNGIAGGAFCYCSGLNNITIPNSVTSIGDNAFYGCRGLTSVTIPNGVISIGDIAFGECTGLTSITIPSSVSSISDYAFEGCAALDSVNFNAVSCVMQLRPDDLPLEFDCFIFDGLNISTINFGDSVKVIPDYFAHGLSRLTHITIPNSVTSIGTGAFYNCTGPTSLTIPNSVTSIGFLALEGCTGLTTVNITDLGAWLNVSFNNYSYPFLYANHLYLNGSEVKDLVIPNTVTRIGEYAFYNCTELTSVNIHKSVTTICDRAFYNCTGLIKITCLSTIPPELIAYEGVYFNSSIYQSATLYVPYSAIEAYRTAEGWKNFLHIEGFYASDFEVDGVYYTITSDNEVVVARSEEPYQGVVIVPSTVTYDGVAYNVTGIDYEAFANADLTHLVLPVIVTDIDPTAFTNCHIGSLVITGNGAWTAGALAADVEQLFVMSGVTSVQGLQVNPATIYSYSTVPPTCNGQTFTGYDGELHVPASSLAAYFTAPYWNYFINIIGDAVEPTGITISKDSVDLLKGNQLTLTATPAPANVTPDAIIWTSSNEQVVTVNNGVITAVSAGECDIKAILLDKEAVCHVTVTEILPTELTLSQEYAMLEVGSQLTLIATITPDDATTTTVTWETSNPSVATVVDGIVTAVAPGECYITASCGGCQATCHVIVVEHFIYISLDQHKANLLPNHILLLTPTVTPVATSLVVTSSDPAVAAARLANGKVQVVGISEGTAVITVASTDGYATPDSCVVTVYTERGDLNSDGYVNMDDLSSLINYLLTDDPEGINLKNAAACDGHAGIGMDDLSALINFLLTDQWPNPVEPEQPEEPTGTQTITVNGVSFKMVPVEGGTFMMGATADQGSEASDSEKPAHEVTVSSFNIGQTEVTQALWTAVMGTNPSHFNDDPNRPVECVSWNDCQEFVAKLNQMTGMQFRLPTEAEWEYAARGGNKSQGYKYAGSDNVDDVAWYMANIPSQTSGTPGYGTQPVATKSPNELCLYDMSGNVWEWCFDRFGSYTSEPQTDPTGPTTGSTRAARGGSWFNSYATNCRVARRNGCYTTDNDTYLGLRLVLDDAEVYNVNGVSFTMVPVRGGTFMMGATEEEDADYQVFMGSPKHQVTVSSYSIGQTEVTQELWEAVMGSNPSTFTGNPQRPVETVSYDECQAFIAALNNLTGKQFRMPTEAEWEFAARGGILSHGYTYAGSDSIGDVAWYSGNSGNVPHAVANKLSNELGIYDMCGNVNEWVNDWYSLYTEDPVTDPTGPETGRSRIHRGGRHNAGVKYCRITRRDGFIPDNKRNYLGLRLAQ